MHHFWHYLEQSEVLGKGGTRMPASANAASCGDEKKITETVDTILKKRLAGIFDDIYALKKQIKTSQCIGSGGGGSESSTLSKSGSLVSDSDHTCTKYDKECQQNTAIAKSNERINFASDQLGAKVEKVVAEPLSKPGFISALLKLDFNSNPPINMLIQSMEPGNCFAFKGARAEVIVKLANQASF